MITFFVFVTKKNETKVKSPFLHETQSYTLWLNQDCYIKRIKKLLESISGRMNMFGTPGN